MFSTAAGYGHFHPLVPLARALKERGHEVAFAASASVHPLIEAAGFSVFPVGGDLASDPEYQEIKALQKLMPLDLEYELFSYTRLFCGVGTRLRTPQLVELAKEWQPDMLIREASQYSAAIAAEYLGLPHATVSFAASLRGFSIFERDIASQLDPIRKSWGLPSDPALHSLYRYLYLSYSPPSFALQEVGGPDVPGAHGSIPPATAAVPATTHFIRPDFFDQATEERLPGWVDDLPAQPTVYVTLGTEVNSEPSLYPSVMQTIITGLRDLPVNLIVTLGRSKDPADFGPQPPNVHIERYIPQSLLLPRCALIVMHAGTNTLLQTLDIGLPSVVVPLIADQFFNAQVARSMRLGQVTALGQLTPASIRAAVEEVLANPVYRQNVGQLQAEMHALPDQQYAVELVERVAAGHEPALNAAFGATN